MPQFRVFTREYPLGTTNEAAGFVTLKLVPRIGHSVVIVHKSGPQVFGVEAILHDPRDQEADATLFCRHQPGWYVPELT